MQSWEPIGIRRYGAVGTLLVLLAAYCGGCEIPAQLVWSPDGSQAAYRNGNAAWLINEQGTVLRPLGTSMGGFAWSPDSRSLFYAAVDEEMNPATPLDLHWLTDGTAPTRSSASLAASPTTSQPSTGPSTAPATTQPVLVPLPTTPIPPGPTADPGNTVAVSRLHDGKVDPLFRLAGQTVWHLQLSPDGEWIAAITAANKNGEADGPAENDLFVYSMRSNRLYLVSRFCGMGACFTAANKLAYVEPSGADAVGQIVGRLVEATLDDGTTTLAKEPLLDVVVPTTRWIQACDAGVIFTAEPIAYPAHVTPQPADHIYKLYHYARADHGLTVLADDVGELFDKSPDGKRILFEKIATATHKDELFVMNANGSDPHMLRPLDGYVGSPKPPMWPAWRGNDQVSFLASADTAQTVHVDDNDRKIYDVIVYHLSDKGELDPLQTLSGDWTTELKPYSRLENKSGANP